MEPLTPMVGFILELLLRQDETAAPSLSIHHCVLWGIVFPIIHKDNYVICVCYCYDMKHYHKSWWSGLDESSLANKSISIVFKHLLEWISLTL